MTDLSSDLPGSLCGITDEFFHKDIQYIESPTPPVCLEEETMMGIDEAGRGPVLGPMVYGTSYYPVSRKSEAEKMKFADSKTLDLSQREKLFSSINDSNSWIGWRVAVISPSYISNCMLRRTKYSLNEISHDAAIDLIRSVLSNGVKLTEVYVDTVGDPRKYESKLEEIFPLLKITVAKKADSLYPVVSAASICAKVVRDICIKRWVFIEQSTDADHKNITAPFGCGYPSDPVTKEWLNINCDPVFGYPSIVRFGWSTCQNKLDSRAYEVRWVDCEDDEGQGQEYAKISQFFSTTGRTQPSRHRYFEEKGLKSVSLF